MTEGVRMLFNASVPSSEDLIFSPLVSLISGNNPFKFKTVISTHSSDLSMHVKELQFSTQHYEPTQKSSSGYAVSLC